MRKIKERYSVQSKAYLAGAVLAALSGIGRTFGQNTPTTFNTSATDLSSGSNYSTSITPTAASTNDVEFTGTYTTPTLNVNGSALIFGTLNDLSATAIVITNSNSTPGSINLSTPANAVSSTPADLLYVATGANLNFSNGTAGGNGLIISATGNIDTVGTLAINAPVSIGAGNTLTFTGAGTSTINASIGVTSAALAIGGTGTLQLYGSNNYSGGTTFSAAGVIRVANNNALGSGTLTFNASGTLATLSGGPATTISNPIVINAGVTSAFDGGYATLTLPGNISGAGAVQKTSTGNVIFSGTNTYTGGTTLVGGFTTFSSLASVPTTGQISINSGAALVDTGAYSTVAGVLGSGTINTSSAGSIALTASSAENISFAGFNTLALSSTGAVTYSGTITPGTNGYELGGPSPSNLTVSSNLSGANALTVQGTGIVTLSGNNSYTGLTTIATSGGSLVLAGASTYAGGFSIGTGATLNVSTAQNFAATVSGAGVLKASSTGTVIFSGSDTYTGGTAISNGFGEFSAQASIPATGQISISSGAALVDAGAYSTVTAYLGSGKISTSSAGSIALTANSSENINFAGFNTLALSSTGPVTYSGTITPGTSGYELGGPSPSNLTVASNLSGSNTLLVQGSGIITLSGNNSYTGATAINNSGGSLVLATPGSATAYTGGFSIGTGTTLNVSSGTSINMSTGGITLKSSTLIVGGSLTSGAALSVGTNAGNQVTVPTGGSLTVASLSESYQGNYNISGSFIVIGASSMSVNSTINISGTGTFNASGFSLGNGTNINDTVTNLNVLGTLAWGANNGTNKYFNIGSGSTVNATALSNSYAYNTSVLGTLNVSGGGTSAVNGTNVWTGTGSMLFGGGFNVSNYTIINESISTFNVSGGVNIGATTNGNTTGTFNQSAGTVNFTSASSNVVVGSGTTGGYYGAYNLGGGTLNVPNSNLIIGGSSSSNGTVNIMTGTANLYGVSFNSTGTANLNVSGGVMNIGAGGINSTASGTRNVNFGAVTIGASGNWSSNVAIALQSSSPGTTFNTLDSVNNTTARTITLNGGVSGSGGLNVTGTGALVLGGSNSYSGNTNVSSGSLFVNGTLNGSAVTLAAGTTLGGSGSISSYVELPSTANLSAGYGGTGTLTLNSLTFDGTSNLSIGALAGYASTPALNVQGTLTANGSSNSITINVANLTGTSPGATYILAQYSGAIGGTGNTAFVLGTLPSGTQGSLSFPSGQIDLTLGGANVFWTGAVNSKWDGSTANFATVNSSGGATATNYVDNVGEQVIFGDSVAGTPVTNTTVNISSGTVSPAGVTFNNSSTNYTIQSTGGYGIGGSGGIVVNGSGIVTIKTSNSFTGGTVLNAGTLQIAGDTALGAAPSTPSTNITFNGGTLQFLNPTTLNANRSMVLNAASTVIDVNSNAVSIPGVISGSGTLIPANTGNGSSGVLSLSGNNTYTGGTTLNAGVTLNIASDSSLGAVPSSATTSLLANGGTLQAGASGISLTANRIVYLNSGGLTIDENSNSIAITGQVEGTGPLYVINTGNGSGGVLKLNTTASNTDNGPLIILAGTVDIGNTGTNYVYSSQDFSAINVSSGANLVFNGTNTFGYAGSGSYKPPINVLGGTVTNGGADNYIGGQITMTGGSFTGTSDFRLQGYTSLYPTANVTTNPASTTATFSVNTLIFYSTNAVFNVAQGTVSGGGPDLLISSNINSSGGTTGFTKLGAGTLELTGINNYSGGTTVSGGTVIFASAKSFPQFTNLSVTSGNLIAAAHLASATGAAKNNLFVNTLSLAGSTGAWTGQVDLNNNDMIVQASGSGTSISNITSMVAQGYNNGNWNGPGGIISSSAAADTAHLHALGVIVNDDGGGTGTPLYGANAATPSTFDGVSNTVEGDILIKYTYYGDANLDGKVDGSDYSRIDNGVLLGLTGWFNGDFNYDGVINGSDYTLIDNAYNTQGALVADQIATPTAQIAGGVSAVPEPASLGLMSLGAVSLLGRRRRRI